MITGAQVRAARALLGWTARSLAKKAIVPEHSLEWIEGDGKLTGKDRANLEALRDTLEAGGVEFIGSVGVQLPPDRQKRTAKAKRP
jgi:transcriptional regulator with XRE-family HTH domain